jgi:hypothetical protein
MGLKGKDNGCMCIGKRANESRTRRSLHIFEMMNQKAANNHERSKEG